MDYKKSYIVGLGVRLTGWDQKRMKKRPKRKKTTWTITYDLIEALFGIFLVLLIGTIAFFIETPIRMLFSKGSVKEKVKYWFYCWRSMFEGMGIIEKR